MDAASAALYTMESTMSTGAPVFTSHPILSYLALPETYTPSPKESPIDFLNLHIRQLPPHLLLTFSLITNSKQRTAIPTIRNRRLQYTLSDPEELGFVEARSQWPLLWEGRERRGVEEGKEERNWAQSGFLEGNKKHVGKLAALLGEYEEEREAERIRMIRRERPTENEFVPEEDSDSDDEMEDASQGLVNEVEEMGIEETKASFERLVKEKFIYGLLDVSTMHSPRLIQLKQVHIYSLLIMTRSTGMISSTLTMTEKLKKSGLTMRTKINRAHVLFTCILLPVFPIESLYHSSTFIVDFHCQSLEFKTGEALRIQPEA